MTEIFMVTGSIYFIAHTVLALKYLLEKPMIPSPPDFSAIVASLLPVLMVKNKESQPEEK